MQAAQQSSTGGVFLNGRAQVIEMLQMLSPQERERILNHVRIKNPALASELVEESVCFEDIGRLNQRELVLLLQYITPVVLGNGPEGQRFSVSKKNSSSAPRQYAEEAFDIMMTPLENERTNIRRAQQKVIEICIQLRRRRQIHL